MMVDYEGRLACKWTLQGRMESDVRIRTLPGTIRHDNQCRGTTSERRPCLCRLHATAAEDDYR